MNMHNGDNLVTCRLSEESDAGAVFTQTTNSLGQPSETARPLPGRPAMDAESARRASPRLHPE